MDPTPQKTEKMTLDGLYTFVKKLVTALAQEGLDYAFTGALAASFYGVPRTTADIDILIAVAQKDVKNRLASAFRLAGLDVEEKRIDDAIVSGYKIITFKRKTSPYKVDVILTDQLRKSGGTIAGVDTFLQAPEDLVNAKLRMIKATIEEERTMKDEDDVRAILRFTDVDKKIIQEQAKKDKTLAIWKRLGNE
jgi:hypothetical protein